MLEHVSVNLTILFILTVKKVRIRRESTPREKLLNASRNKNEGAHTRSGEGGRRAYYVTPDLSYYWGGGREIMRG